MTVNVLLVGVPFLKELQQRQKKEPGYGLTEQDFRGEDKKDCFLFIYSVSYNQSSFFYSLAPEPCDISECKNRREQLKQLHLIGFIVQKMSNMVKANIYSNTRHFVISDSPPW